MTTTFDTLIERIAQRCVSASTNWPLLKNGPLTPGTAQTWLEQHIIRNRLFSSSFRPAWMSHCTDDAVVRKTIGQMLEEIVYDANIKAAHTKILFEMGRAIGLSDDQIHHPEPSPETDIWCQVTENLCRTRHWTIGWLSTSIEEFILVGAGINGTIISADRWINELNLTEADVFCLRYHEIADLEHAGHAVWAPIRRNVTTEALADDILAGLDTALEAAGIFYRGVARLGAERDEQGAAIPKNKAA